MCGVPAVGAVMGCAQLSPIWPRDVGCTLGIHPMPSSGDTEVGGQEQSPAEGQPVPSATTLVRLDDTEVPRSLPALGGRTSASGWHSCRQYQVSLFSVDN